MKVNSVQLAEFTLFYNSIRVNYTGAIATNPGGRNPSKEMPQNAIDNNISTKWLDFNKKALIVKFAKATLVSSYNFTTANDRAPERDPISWKIYGSNDGIIWVILDTVIKYNTPSGTITTTFQVNQSTPILTDFNIPTKTYGNPPFQITQPISNSSGAFSYTSSNLSVATISENTITIVGSGTSIITATQAATANYTSGTITTTFQVNQSTPTNPTIIETGNELLYFMNTNATYGDIEKSVTIPGNLTSLSEKALFTNNDNIKIIYSMLKNYVNP
jgi:hypothetical protein